MTLSTALILAGNLPAAEQAENEQLAADLREVFHGLALAVLELGEGIEWPSAL